MQILIKIYDFLAYMLFERWYYYLAFFIFIFIADRLLKIYFNNILGWAAEKKVTRIISKLNPDKYKVINNIMLETEGNTTQIDHLIISEYGIFVIETKNYYGWIKGNDYGDWFLTIYRYKRKIINPIRQNYGHVQVLKNLLKDYPNISYYPIVVFTKRSIFKVNTRTDVVYNTDLLTTIEKYKTEIIPKEIKDKIYQYLISLNIKDRKSRKEHISRIKEKKKDNKNKIMNNICPKCGGLLVIKDGKYGKFKGCRNFPKCKFTANL
ncbi:MAG: NERD domain-containing protein [Actinobacteria bacterium]|nr:NERD domain-containing protein [Actinomycetota bacterium]